MKHGTCTYHRREECPTCYPADARVKLALAIFRATRGKPHPANGGQHYQAADAILADLPELRAVLEEDEG